MRCAGRHWQVAEVCRLMMLLPLTIDQPKFQSRYLSGGYSHSRVTGIAIMKMSLTYPFCRPYLLKSLFSEMSRCLLQHFSTKVESLRGHQIAVWGLPAPELKLTWTQRGESIGRNPFKTSKRCCALSWPIALAVRTLYMLHFYNIPIPPPITPHVHQNPSTFLVRIPLEPCQSPKLSHKHQVRLQRRPKAFVE